MMDLFLIIFFGLFSFALLSLWITYQSRAEVPATTANEESLSEKNADRIEYESIEPLPDFNWTTTSPIKQRPFKPMYHLTMAVENITLSELLAMDNTYLDRINLRKQIMSDHLNSTVQCNSTAESAVREFYSWILSTYLPKRFPRIYQLTSDSLFNTVNNTHIPLHPPKSPIDALRLLGENIDTDFLFLLPTATPPTSNPDLDQAAPTYSLQAFVTCFPSGFSTLSKLGLTLSDIHHPVPGYRAKLAKSMDRFFARLPVGRIVRRSNWTVTTSDELFCQTGTHLHGQQQQQNHHPSDSNEADTTTQDAAAQLAAEIQRQKDSVRVEACRLRSERQTLHRLPGTGALVFGFKTYLYRIEDVKAEGSGEALATAIEGLRKGNVPEFEFYKRGVVWGEKVVEYLRS